MTLLIADGNNIVRFGRSSKTSKVKGRFKHLSMVINYCKQQGINLKILVSPYLKKHIDDQFSYNHLLKKKFVIVTPADQDCDLFILESARQLNGIILSNDKFQKYESLYPTIRKRRVSFLILDEKIIISQLTVQGGELCV